MAAIFMTTLVTPIVMIAERAHAFRYAPFSPLTAHSAIAIIPQSFGALNRLSFLSLGPMFVPRIV